MKLKGVGFFEAHIEKLLLGLMVAVAAGVVVMQFSTNPNAVNIGNQELRPERAYDPVERKAQEVDARMSATDVSPPEVDGRTAMLTEVDDRVMGAVSPQPRITAMGAPAEIDEALFKGQAEDVEYAVVTPPAPSQPVVASYAGTLDPSLLAENEDLAAIVGPAQPFDIAMVSVEVTYDGTELAEMFRSGGTGEIRSIPINWRRNIEALGLQLERQERLSDGSWGSTTVIDGLPGEQTLYEFLQVDAAADALGRDQLASDARLAYEEAPAYRRPYPLRTIAGAEWKPPTVYQQELAAQGGADKQDQARRLLSQRANEERALDRNQQELDDNSEGQGGGRRGAGRDPGQDPDDQPTDRRTQQLLRQQEQIEARIADLDAQIRALGYDPQTGQPIAVAGFTDETVDERLLEDDNARLWAHDVTAQPGKTYRYRTRLAVNNPMFGREPVLIEEQRPLAASPVLFSEPSAWSNPVVVAPKTAFFLASASDGRGGALGPNEPSASIEVFTFYYGYYRRSTLTLRPGEMVATEADMPDDLRLPVLAMGPEGEGEVPPPTGRGGGREGVVGASPDPTGGEETDQQGDPVPDKVSATMDVYLVDVTFEPIQAEALGDRTTQAVAYFSQVDGLGLMRRVASTDRSGTLYRMLTKSAQEGRDQGQPRESLEIPEGDRGGRERPQSEPRGPVGGGGKGGGGGG
ncbi:MAG: hypothetical protein ACIAS6_12615 [Phycisphaerales bacterium JB060]